jgi:very-short-patch-repair endonuclease
MLRRPETYIARKLRREMSLPEVLLWQELRGQKTGAKFRKQHPIGPYTVDFYYAGARLIVEVDGEAHDRGNRPQRDASRDEYLLDRGYQLLRIPAAEVLRDLAAVVQHIAERANNPLHRASGTVPLPASGEDL